MRGVCSFSFVRGRYLVVELVLESFGYRGGFVIKVLLNEYYVFFINDFLFNFYNVFKG